MAPKDRVFMPVPNIRTYQRDLQNAGIDYQDADGRFLDFHALRATFATRLLRHGVYPSKAIRLTRHASVKTLEDFYDKLGLSDAVDAMDQLPGLGLNENMDADPPTGPHGHQEQE